MRRASSRLDTISSTLSSSPRTFMFGKQAPLATSELKPGQESVWDYPRPPRLERCEKAVRVVFNGETIVNSSNCYRLLETSHPPAYYIPPSDVQSGCFKKTSRTTFCEFKGSASYFDIVVKGKVANNAAWAYQAPANEYESLKDFLCIYASKVDACYVDEEKAQPQEGDYYGGWITSNIVGPFKGGTGTLGW